MLKWPDKDPDDVNDFGVDWTDRLAGDQITGSSWIIEGDDAALVQDSTSYTTATTTLWLSGGTDGNDYEITNRITTAGGRTIDQTMKLRVRER